ncbi:hypothetical protein KSF78_0008639 [Schistosoma japonicum]|nr:hypothetical protein KSF78_0008639 [Schistosoma japonicum]
MNYQNTEKSTRNDDDNKSICYHCLIHIIGSSNVYQPNQYSRRTNFCVNKTSKFVLTLRLTKLTMLFHVSMRQTNINLRVYHVCGKLLCIPLLTEAWLNNDDLLIKNWNLLFENTYILHHIGLRLYTNIHLDPSSLNNTSSSFIGWFVRLIDLKVYGLRISILEELIDLLNWKLYVTQFSVLTAPSSTPFSTISSLPTCSRYHCATCQDPLAFLEHSFPFNESSVLSDELSNIYHHTSDNSSNMLTTNFQCVQQLMNPIKFCISFLPSKFYDFDKHHPFEQQLLPSESSLQFYFTSSHFSTEINLPYPLNDSQAIEETPQKTSNPHTSSSATSSSSLPLSRIILSDQLTASNHKVGSKNSLNCVTVQNFRFRLNDFHLLNGWNSQAQYCLLDIRINLIEATEQLESSLCNTYLNILHPCIIYTHDNSMTELKFYQKLLSINYLIGRRFQTLCQSSGISGRSTLPMTTNISLSTPNCQKDTYQTQSNFMTQQKSSRKKFYKLLEYFGLNTRQLNVRIHFGGVDEDCTNGCISKNSSNSSIICETEELRIGFDEVIHHKSTDLANYFHKQRQRYHHDGIVMERFQSKDIPQILFVFIPHLNSPGLQFGFTNFFFNFQFDFHEVYMNTFLMLRVDSQRFSSYFHSIYPMYQSMKLDGLLQITITGTKLIYSYIESVKTSESDISSSFSSLSTFSPSSLLSSLYHYEIVSSSQIRDDLVLSLPELHIDIKFPEQNLKIRQRPENIQHRTEHLKMGLITRANLSWQILLDEFAIHEKRVHTLHEHLNRTVQTGIRLTDEEHQECFARLEAQRAEKYRNRLNRFYRDYTISDELFTFTMDNLKVKALADESVTRGEQIIEQMKLMDNDSPWPNLTYQDFCTLWCRIITLNVDRWRFQLRDYPKPCWDMTDLFLWGKLIIAEQLSGEKGQHKVLIEPSYPWPNYTLIRTCSPTKFYYDLNADVKSFNICYGANFEPTMSWLNQRLDDIKPLTKDKSYPPLGWWDKARFILHGRLLIAADIMQWLYSTRVIRFDGNSDIIYQTASKYDGMCRLFHMPHLEMTVKLDWLSLRDPNDHHSVKSCYTDSLSLEEQSQVCLSQIPRPIRRGTFYQYNPPRKPHFGRLLQSLEFSINIPQLELIFWVSYAKRTGVHVKTGPVQVIGKLQRKIENEIKVHRLVEKAPSNFYLNSSLSPSASVQSVPSRAATTTTLNRSVLNETAATTTATSQTILHPYVMIPPRLPIQRNGLSRRPIINWSVLNLFASVHDSTIHLRHRDNLPGPLIQMLLQCVNNTNQNCTNDIGNNKPNTTINNTIHEMELFNEELDDNDATEAFILIPLLRYQQLCPTVLPSNVTVRVHIPGPRSTTTMASSTTTKAGTTNENNSNNDVEIKNLTPVHHLEIHEFKMRWTEQHRNLVYILMNSYQHAQSLKKNLSTRALHGFRLHPNHTTVTSGTSGGVAFGIGKLGGGGSSSSGGVTTALSRNARSAIQLTNNNYRFLDSADAHPSAVVIQTNANSSVKSSKTTNHHFDHAIKMPTSYEVLPDDTDVMMMPVTTTTGNDKLKHDHQYSSQYNSADIPMSSESRKSRSALCFEQIPMLTQLLDEVDTARFYAYCEEEPKQTDVVSQLQGLHICTSSLVAERNWHLELINPQLLLKTNHLTGYVLVSAARAKLDALTHPPIWKDSQLLNKSSLVGHLECTPDQWLSTADVSDLAHHNLNADEDALSGRPEVVGCGRSVGGVVTACVGFPKFSSTSNNNNNNSLTRTCAFNSGLKLGNDALTSTSLDETEVVRNLEGADTVTLLHHTLNVFTNSLQYHMIVEIVNDLLLYVEPQRKSNYLYLHDLFVRTNDDVNRIHQTTNNDLESFNQQPLRINTHVNLRRSSSTDHLTRVNASNTSNFSQNQSVAEPIVSESVNNQSFMDGGNNSSSNSSKPAEVVRRSEEVLAPDVSGGRYAGGPILRIACSDLAPVGGMSVKEAMEISVAPMVLQMSKQFYRIMMPFFFPEKSEDISSTSTTTTTTTTTITTTSTTTTTTATTIAAPFNTTSNKDANIFDGIVPSSNLTNITTGYQANSLLHLDHINSSSFSRNSLIIPYDNVYEVGVCGNSNALHYLDSNVPTSLDNSRYLYPSDNIIISRKSWFRRHLFRYWPHRSQNDNESFTSGSSPLQPLCSIHTAQQSDIPNNNSDKILSSGSSTIIPTTLSSVSLFPSSNLTVEAAISGRHYCSVNDDGNELNNTLTPASTGAPSSTSLSPSLSSDFTKSKLLQMNMRSRLNINNCNSNSPAGYYPHNQHELKFSNSSHFHECDSTKQSSALLFDHKSDECLLMPRNRLTKYNDIIDNPAMVMQQHLQSSKPMIHLCTHCIPTHLISNNLYMPLYYPMNFGSTPTEQTTTVTTSNQLAVYHPKRNNNNTNKPLNPVDVMRERARQNKVFLYIKIPGFPIRLSYKGEKQKNITDVTRFELFIPTLEYHNCVWTWLDFVMEVKTRIRKQLVREVIKKKLTPRRRFPFLRITGSSNSNINNNNISSTISDSKSHELTESNILLSSVNRFSSLTTDSTVHNDSDIIDDSTTAAAQEEKAQRELEMILGRHAQIQPHKVGKRKRFKSKLF